MAHTKINTQVIPDGTIVSADLAMPITGFSSTGIDDNATSTALIIDSNDRVGINVPAPTVPLEVNVAGSGDVFKLTRDTGTNGELNIDFSGANTNFNSEQGGFTFETSSVANALVIDSSGRAGIGTTPNAWRTTDSVLQLRNRASVAGLANDTHFSNNAYFDAGTTWRAQDTAQAANYYQVAGVHAWRYAGTTTAGAAISWSEAMRLDTSGNLIVGSTFVDAAGSTTLKNEGSIRSVYTSGVGGDSLFGGIAGVSNGYQITADSSNNQTYKWHNGGTPSMTIDSSARIYLGNATGTGYYGSSAVGSKVVINYTSSSTDTNVTPKGLVVRNDDTTANNVSQMVFGTINSGNTPIGTAAIYSVNKARTGSFSSADIGFATAASNGVLTERMRIADNGEIAIQNIVRTTKAVAVGASATTTLMSFNQAGGYHFVISGSIKIYWADLGYPNGAGYAEYHLTSQATTFGGFNSAPIFTQISQQQSLNGLVAPTFGMTYSKTGSVADGTVNVNITTPANFSCTVYCLFEGYAFGTRT